MAAAVSGPLGGRAIWARPDGGAINLTATHISLRGPGRLVFLLATAAVVAAVALNFPSGCARDNAPAAAPRKITITYTASTGATRDAVVLLPAGY